MSPEKKRNFFRLSRLSHFPTVYPPSALRPRHQNYNCWHKTALYDVSTHERINLLALLTRLGLVDQMVLAGENKDIRLRLVAIPVTEEIANLRRRKANKESNGHAPSPGECVSQEFARGIADRGQKGVKKAVRFAGKRMELREDGVSEVRRRRGMRMGRDVVAEKQGRRRNGVGGQTDRERSPGAARTSLPQARMPFGLRNQRSMTSR